jgi:hypothetical protein
MGETTSDSSTLAGWIMAGAQVSQRMRAEQVDALGRGLRAGIQQAEAAGHAAT